MEFKFNVNEIFPQPIVEISNNLIPPGFTGDRRALWNAISKVTEVVNAMGEASSAAQGLSKPITTADRLRNSEHKVYLLIDQSANNGRGAVTGMLKTGKKGLYVFDRNGEHHQVSPPCVLDFYIHESRQRTGLGKQLFEHMLERDGVEPVRMAIDRPSEKFLGFLRKHYQLNDPIRQMNNYVVFDGFFPEAKNERNGIVENNNSPIPVQTKSANGLQTFPSPATFGRYGAPRPPCSMGQIIHNQTSTVQKTQEPTGVQSLPVMNHQYSMNNPNQVPNMYNQNYPYQYMQRPYSDTFLQSQQIPNANTPGYPVQYAQNSPYLTQVPMQAPMQNVNYSQQQLAPIQQNLMPQSQMYLQQYPMNNNNIVQSVPSIPYINGNLQPMQPQFNYAPIQSNIPSQLMPQMTQSLPVNNVTALRNYVQASQPNIVQNTSSNVQENVQKEPQISINQTQSTVLNPESETTNLDVTPSRVKNGLQQLNNDLTTVPEVAETANAQINSNVEYVQQTEVKKSDEQNINLNQQVVMQQDTNEMKNSNSPMQAQNTNINQHVYQPQHQLQQHPLPIPNNVQPMLSNTMIPNVQQTFTPSVHNIVPNLNPVPIQNAINDTNQIQLIQNPSNVMIPNQIYASPITQLPPNPYPAMNYIPQQNVGQFVNNTPVENVNNNVTIVDGQHLNQTNPIIPNTDETRLKENNEQLDGNSHKMTAAGDASNSQQKNVGKFGYPPQYRADIQVVVEEKISTSPKLERPRSLSIQQNEGNNEEPNDVKCEEEPEDEEIVNIEANIQNLQIAHDQKGAKDVEHLSEPDKAAGKKTPSHLTEQGFFDLKFYHNKLW